MGKITSIFKSLLKLAFVISLLLFLFWLSLWYFAKPANDFCNSFTSESNYENVISKAKKLNYRILDNVKENDGSLSIETQDSPFFRMTCVITFKSNKIIKKQVRNSD